MFVIRPIEPKDHAAFVALAQSASIGMTSMPKNPDLLLKKIAGSQRAFSEKKEECYLFVLENQSVEGVCGLFPKKATQSPEFYYQMENISLPRFHLAVSKEMQLLHPIEIQNGSSEICALFLAQTARKRGLGRLLSLCRFLFIAAFPERFERSVTALMRGYFNPSNLSPFWEGVGRKFLDVDFPTLLRLLEEDEQLARNIRPQYPLYAQLLPAEAQAAIGKVHPNTLPAMAMLQREGFLPNGRIDFFDAGPQIVANTQSIRTIQTSRLATIASIALVTGPESLVSNERLAFRAVLTPLHIDGNEAILPKEAADALQVKKGDKIRYV